MAARPPTERRRTPNAGPAASPRGARGRANLAEIAYDRLESLIVTCALPPGQYLSIQDLQQRTDCGRTPTHQAVSRLASDTLILIRPRHGLRIAPIDLARERTLVQLRRSLEGFVTRLAAERCGASERNHFRHLARLLREEEAAMTIDRFNQLDRRIDRLLLQTAGEPFLEHTLRPLHTIFRRSGWIYYKHVRPREGLQRTIACHLEILDAVAANQVRHAVAAADRLVSFSDSMFDALGDGVDPALFDCTAAAPGEEHAA
ncbi:MAG: GntR family transcriptional regulator [Rhodospirillales bacterium]|nr:GntR family transcriptional regulator [Rhodospirillales bacterium]